MGRWFSWFCALLVLPTMVAAEQTREAKRARELQVRETVEQIKRECGITTGQFMAEKKTGGKFKGVRRED